MSFNNVSHKYPKMTHKFTEKDMEEYEINIENEDIGKDYIGADCWGIAIKRSNGTLEPKINTYALFDIIGRSFNVGMIPNAQYDFEHQYRQKLINDFYTFLEDELNTGDSVYIYMFQKKCWRVTVTKHGNGYTYSFHKRLVKRVNKIKEKLRKDLTRFVYTFFNSPYSLSTVEDEKVKINDVVNTLYNDIKNENLVVYDILKCQYEHDGYGKLLVAYFFNTKEKKKQLYIVLSETI
jgi:hypothetical protein